MCAILEQDTSPARRCVHLPVTHTNRNWTSGSPSSPVFKRARDVSKSILYVLRPKTIQFGTGSEHILLDLSTPRIHYTLSSFGQTTQCSSRDGLRFQSTPSDHGDLPTMWKHALHDGRSDDASTIHNVRHQTAATEECRIVPATLLRSPIPQLHHLGAANLGDKKGREISAHIE